jgi:hypothetical protein
MTLWLAEEIKFLNPIVEVLWVRFDWSVLDARLGTNFLLSACPPAVLTIITHRL